MKGEGSGCCESCERRGDRGALGWDPTVEEGLRSGWCDQSGEHRMGEESRVCARPEEKGAKPWQGW